MSNKQIRLESLTRREFREAQEAGHYKVGIIATGSTEQHLEHLAMAQDIASSTYVAERVAERLYPKVVVAVPMSIGLSEHHMHFSGTLSAKPGNWLAVLLDAVESLMRHGIKKVLLLNGHGGNAGPIQGAMEQWKIYLNARQGNPLTDGDEVNIKTNNQYVAALLNREDPGVDLRFYSYWDMIPKVFAQEVLETGRYPGHANEFETSFTMYAIPENVRPGAIRYSDDPGASAATAEKGRLLVDKAIDGVATLVEEMLST